MRIIFLGSGSAFTVGHHNYQSNILLETANDQRLLIDCGTDARLALHELGYNYLTVNDVYVSRLQAAHTGGLEWLAFTHYFDPNAKKIQLYIKEVLIQTLWEHSLSGGLSSLEGINAQLSSYFDVHSIGHSNSFTWNNICFELVQTIQKKSQNAFNDSFGLFFPTDGKHLFITGDTQTISDGILKYYKKADLIFQDCETSIQKTNIHAHFDDLVRLPEEIKKKMWLYDYNPGNLPDAKSEGFLGFVQKGQIFDFQHKHELNN
jgi:ribonuclease BN (tRNA processing enzyme)